MYHRTGTGSVDAKWETFPSFAGLGGLDIKCFQEMYLDASTLNSPSISPASTDLSTTSLSPVESSTFGSNAFLAAEKLSNATSAQPQLQQDQPQQQQSSSNLLGISTSTLLTNSAYLQQQQQQHQKQQQYNNQLLLQQQQQQYSNQLLVQQQQQVAAALLAQQQQQQQQRQKNEISQSLKTFAMLSAYKSGNDIYQTTPQSPVEAIMQDFASNGYVSDDVNFYQQQQQSLMNFHHSQLNSAPYIANNMNSGNSNLHNLSNLLNGNNNAISTMNQQQQQQAFNSNYTEMRKNFWMLHLPPQQYFSNTPQLSPTEPTRAAVAAAAAAAAATAAAAANIDYNSKNNSGSCSSSSSGSANGSGGSVGNNKRPQRRFGANKTDKFSAVKHCVFCENNNEPEAVVKSHAVRDSLGRVLCPKLRTYICPICKASGDMAHTVKYCPQKPVITMEDAIKAESFRLAKSNYYKQQMKV